MKLRMLLAVAAIGVLFSVTGCTSAPDTGEWSVSVEVVGQGTHEFTNKVADEIGPVDIKAAMKDGDDIKDEDTWRGILVYDLVNYYGLDDFSVISIEGEDGKVAEISPDRLETDRTGFAWAKNGKALDSDSGPVKFVNHNRGPKHWIDKVVKITIIE